MRMQLRGIWLVVAMLLSENALAFSSNGHQSVGAIADAMLVGSRAGREVKTILGVLGDEPLTLEQVAVWPDCARGVHPEENFAYDPGKYRDLACARFEDKAGVKALVAYVKRNNSNCMYANKMVECHKAFHFADVASGRGRYDASFPGTSSTDVVHAMGAAIIVLRGGKAPAPFRIASKKEALVLLTHLAGDVHQPLHVGAVYLDGQGIVRDPGTEAVATPMNTRGGNSLLGTGGNLHHQWDETHYPLTDPSLFADLASAASSVAPSDGAYVDWPLWPGPAKRYRSRRARLTAPASVPVPRLPAGRSPMATAVPISSASNQRSTTRSSKAAPGWRHC